jgi:hypothetical protein
MAPPGHVVDSSTPNSIDALRELAWRRLVHALLASGNAQSVHHQMVTPTALIHPNGVQPPLGGNSLNHMVAHMASSAHHLLVGQHMGTHMASTAQQQLGANGPQHMVVHMAGTAHQPLSGNGPQHVGAHMAGPPHQLVVGNGPQHMGAQMAGSMQTTAPNCPTPNSQPPSDDVTFSADGSVSGGPGSNGGGGGGGKRGRMCGRGGGGPELGSSSGNRGCCGGKPGRNCGSRAGGGARGRSIGLSGGRGGGRGGDMASAGRHPGPSAARRGPSIVPRAGQVAGADAAAGVGENVVVVEHNWPSDDGDDAGPGAVRWELGGNRGSLGGRMWRGGGPDSAFRPAVPARRPIQVRTPQKYPQILKMGHGKTQSGTRNHGVMLAQELLLLMRACTTS